MKMIKFIQTRNIKKSRENSEKGQALLFVLVLLLVGVVIVTSSLIYMGTTLKTNQVYVTNTTSLYAAEAGIQDGIWNVRYQTSSDLNGIPDFEPVSPNTNIYTDYDFNTHGWTYPLSDPTTNNDVNINSYPVDVSLTNTWVPLGITAPISDDTAALSVLNNVGGTNPDGSHVNLIVSGQATLPYSSDSYSITISYNGTVPLKITSIRLLAAPGIFL